MLRHSALPLAAALMLAACSHVPISTIYKLWAFDAASADPAVLRTAVRYPSVLVPRSQGVVLSFSAWVDGETDHHKKDFILEASSDPSDLAALAHYRRPGETVAAYRLSGADVERVRRLQADSAALERTSRRKVQREITVKADACRQGPLPTGVIPTSTYLKLSAKDGYMPVLEDVDLRSELGDAALKEHLPPCSGGEARNAPMQ